MCVFLCLVGVGRLLCVCLCDCAIVFLCVCVLSLHLRVFVVCQGVCVRTFLLFDVM